MDININFGISEHLYHVEHTHTIKTQTEIQCRNKLITVGTNCIERALCCGCVPWDRGCLCQCSRRLEAVGQPDHGPYAGARCHSPPGSRLQRGGVGLSGECELRSDSQESYREGQKVE